MPVYHNGDDASDDGTDPTSIHVARPSIKSSMPKKKSRFDDDNDGAGRVIVGCTVSAEEYFIGGSGGIIKLRLQSR